MPQKKKNLAIITVRINQRNARFVDKSVTFSNFKISVSLWKRKPDYTLAWKQAICNFFSRKECFKCLKCDICWSQTSRYQSSARNREPVHLRLCIRLVSKKLDVCSEESSKIIPPFNLLCIRAFTSSLQHNTLLIHHVVYFTENDWKASTVFYLLWMTSEITASFKSQSI